MQHLVSTLRMHSQMVIQATRSSLNIASTSGSQRPKHIYSINAARSTLAAMKVAAKRLTAAASGKKLPARKLVPVLHLASDGSEAAHARVTAASECVGRILNANVRY